MNIKKVLVPVDFSPPSTLAVNYGVALARKLRAKLSLLHVVESPSLLFRFPTEVEGLVQFAETFNREIAQRMRAGEIGELASFSFPCSLHRHFDPMPRLPQPHIRYGLSEGLLRPGT